MNILFFKF